MASMGLGRFQRLFCDLGAGLHACDLAVLLFSRSAVSDSCVPVDCGMPDLAMGLPSSRVHVTGVTVINC